MSGFDNEVMYASGERLESSTTQAIALMQKTATDVSIINYTGNPEGLISANPASLCHVPSTGALYKKNSGTGNTGWNAIQSGSNTISGNTGTATASSGNINLTTSNATVKFIGSGSTINQDFSLTNLVLGSSLPSLTTGINNVGMGNASLQNLTVGIRNTALGDLSGTAIATGSDNVAVGYGALTTYTGSFNVGVGSLSLFRTVTGTSNTGVGYSTLANCTSDHNVAIGANAAIALVGGEQNISIGSLSFATAVSANYCVGVGYQALNACTADNNTAIGRASLVQLASGTGNTAVGFNSGFQILGSQNTLMGSSVLSLGTGSNNIAIGYLAGNAYTSTESSNLVIGNVGIITENNVLRIGTQGNGSGQQNKAYIAGITGVTVSNTQMVTLDSTTGQLGASTVLYPGVATNFGTSAAPTGTNSTAAYVMLGLGSSWKLTPSKYGTVRLHINGQLNNGTTADGINVIIAYGTGTAPINGAGVTGTTVGLNTIFTDLTGLTTNGVPFSKDVIVTGLTPTTAYWFDLQFKAVTGGTASVINAEFIAQELQY